MSGAKREPSSSVKKPTAIGCTVSMPRCSSVSMTAEPGEHAEVAVEAPAGRHRVDVRAGHHPGRRRVGARPGGHDVADGVDADVEPEVVHPPDDRSPPPRSASLNASRAQPSSPSGPLIAPISTNSTIRA